MRGARQPHVAASRPIQMLDCLTQTAPKANLCEKISNSEAARPESRVWRQKNDTIPINERIWECAGPFGIVNQQKTPWHVPQTATNHIWTTPCARLWQNCTAVNCRLRSEGGLHRNAGGRNARPPPERLLEKKKCSGFVRWQRDWKSARPVRTRNKHSEIYFSLAFESSCRPTGNCLSKSKGVCCWDCGRQATMRGARQPHVAVSRPIQTQFISPPSNSRVKFPESREWRQKNDTIPINERIWECAGLFGIVNQQKTPWHVPQTATNHIWTTPCSRLWQNCTAVSCRLRSDRNAGGRNARPPPQRLLEKNKMKPTNPNAHTYVGDRIWIWTRVPVSLWGID